MNYLIKYLLTLAFLSVLLFSSCSDETTISEEPDPVEEPVISVEPEELAILLNEIMATLKGDLTVEPVFITISQACDSSYINCNEADEIIGLDLQFMGLRGTIPEEVMRFGKLESILLDHNYLKGTIPEGLSSLLNLQELDLQGNTLVGPLPTDLISISEEVEINLAKNAIYDIDSSLIQPLNIMDQVDLSNYNVPGSNSETGIATNIPRFPGCEDILDIDELQNCSTEKMLFFIYDKLIYPREALQNEYEETIPIEFVVDSDGDIITNEILEDNGFGTAQSALWTVDRMNYMDENWIPARTADDVAIEAKITVFIKFLLQILIV